MAHPVPDPPHGSYDGPRERLLSVGIRHLACRELLALVVGSGSRAGNVFEVADRLLGFAEGSLRRLGSADPRSLESVAGVGHVTAARVLAAMELGRRAESESPLPGDPIRGPEDVFKRMGPRLRHLLQEEFHVLLLNTRHRVVREVSITRGILDASLIHPREVFRTVVVEGAAGIILVHNHPSGDPAPSPEDRAITRQLSEAGRALGIPVLDHVVIGDGRFHSLAADLGL